MLHNSLDFEIVGGQLGVVDGQVQCSVSTGGIENLEHKRNKLRRTTKLKQNSKNFVKELIQEAAGRWAWPQFCMISDYVLVLWLQTVNKR